MQGVWRELFRRRRDKYRSTNTFFHAATNYGIASDHGIDLQYAQAKVLFKEAVAIGRSCTPSFFSAQMRPDYYWQRFMPLVNDAHNLRRFARPSDRIHKLTAALLNAAGAYEKLKDAKAIFDRDRFGKDKMVAIDFSVNIARILRDRFGSPLPAVAAAIASVTLDRQVKSIAVREWCRGQFGQGLAKPKARQVVPHLVGKRLPKR